MINCVIPKKLKAKVEPWYVNDKTQIRKLILSKKKCFNLWIKDGKKKKCLIYTEYLNSKRKLQKLRTKAQKLYWDELYKSLRKYWNNGNSFQY